MTTSELNLLLSPWATRCEYRLARLVDVVRARRRHRMRETSAPRVVGLVDEPHARAVRQRRPSGEVVDDNLLEYFDRVTC